MSCLKSPCAVRTALVAALALRAAAAADSLPPEGFLPGAKMVVGIRVSALLEGVSLAMPDEIRTQTTSVLAKTPLAGMDPFRDIDEIVLTSTGEGQNPPALVIVRGHFPIEALSKGATKYHEVTLVATGNPAAGVAILDPTTLLVGETTLLHAAIDRSGTPSPLDPDLFERMEAMRGKYDLWATGERPENVVLPKGAEALQSLDRFEFGISVSHGLDLSASIHVRSADDAAKLAASVQLLEMMLKSQPSAKAAQFHLESADNTLHVTLRVPEVAWKKALLEQKTTLRQALAQQFHLGPVEVASAHPPVLRPGRRALRAVVASPAPEPMPEAQPMAEPAPRETQIVTATDGSTVIVTLPGRR